MKKIFFSTAVILTFSQSLAFAMLDEDFKGDTLVIGGLSRKAPDKLSVNIEDSDIIGSGWDADFLRNNFTKNKYNHIIYEHVGYSLVKEDRQAKVRADSDHLAKIHFDLLKPGGTFTFLSYGFVYDELSPEVQMILNRSNHSLKFNEHHPMTNFFGCCWASNYFTIDKPDDREFSFPAERLPKVLWKINMEWLLTDTILPLAQAGFKDILVQKEKVTGYSLHIVAKKPE